MNQKNSSYEQITEAEIKRYVSRIQSKFEQVTSTWRQQDRRKKQAEVHLAYWIDDMTRGPRYIVPKLVQDCEKWVSSLVAA